MKNDTNPSASILINIRIKNLRETGIILDGNSGCILMTMVEKLNRTIVQRL